MPFFSGQSLLLSTILLNDKIINVAYKTLKIQETFCHLFFLSNHMPLYMNCYYLMIQMAFNYYNVM